ncbi:hypothetical protein GCM10027613_44100 [Microlunatus endophyticus]
MIKLAHRNGLIEQATPEFDHITKIATATGTPAQIVLSEAIAAAWTAGLRPGEPVPENAHSTSSNPTEQEHLS